MTYAGAYGRYERVPVDRLLCREDAHPLGIRRDDELSTRRDEVTALAAAEADEAATANKKWTFGVAAGALLMAGTFAAGALGITGGAAPVAGSAPEHAPAAPGHAPAGGPVIGAPAPGNDHLQQAPEQQDPRLQETQPSSASPKGGTTDRDLSNPTGESARSGGSGTGSDTGSGSGTGSGTGGDTGGGVDTPAPQQPAPQQPAPQQQQQQGPLGQVLTPVVDTADDILSPVTGLLGLSSADQSTQRGATPSGPALTMINPLGDLLGG